jgi:hypothetical protein
MIAFEKDERESPRDFHERLQKMRSLFMLFFRTPQVKTGRGRNILENLTSPDKPPNIRYAVHNV